MNTKRHTNLEEFIETVPIDRVWPVLKLFHIILKYYNYFYCKNIKCKRHL